VFHTNRSGNDEIWITNTTGSTATKLTDGASPAWTADGRIVFVRYTNNSGALFWIDPANPSVVHPIDIGGGNAQRPSAVLP
jgi:Tol biopolymer transport system component